MRSRAEAFDESSRKRALVEPDPGLETKRQRTAPVTAEPQLIITPLSPGPHSLAEVFTLTQNEGLKGFDVGSAVPAELAAKISITTIARLEDGLLERAISVCTCFIWSLYRV